MKHILSVSMPRSGHDLLKRQLNAYYGEFFHYCEYYQPKNCCKQIPCTQIDRNLDERHIFMQKNHDFKLKTPIFKNYRYIIQYRHPVPRVISYFEDIVRRTPKKDTKEEFELFLSQSINYYIQFYKKYIQSAKARLNCIIIKYEDLVSNNRETLRKIINFLNETTGEFDLTMYSNAAEELRYRTRNEKFKEQRKIVNFRYFDFKLFKSFEEKIFSQLPNIPYQSCLNEIDIVRSKLKGSRLNLLQIQEELAHYW
jgi:hypothetical protein